MKLWGNETVSRAVVVALFLVLFAYVAARASLLSFTHDEALTFTILEGSRDLVRTANNHVLNTFLSKIAYALFGGSEFVLRLPNVLAFALYYLALCSIARSFGWRRGGLLLFAVFAFNPFVLEFFSLARGYGLSLGFMMASLALFVRNSSASVDRGAFLWNASISLLLGSLALYSNLAMVNYLIALCLVLGVQHYLRFKELIWAGKVKDWRFLLPLVIVGVSIFWGIYRLFLLKRLNHLFFGSETFWDMLRSLVESCLYLDVRSSVTNGVVVSLLVVALVSFTRVVADRSLRGELAGVLMLLGLLFAGLAFENLVFEAMYPRGRTALVLFPLLGLMLCFLIDGLFGALRLKGFYAGLVSVALALPFIVNFFAGANLSHCKVWSYDAKTKAAMMRVKTETDGAGENATISNHWLYEPAINYYIKTRDLNLQKADREGARMGTDYIYTLKSGDAFPGYVVLERYEELGSVLLRKEDLPRRR